MPTNARLFDMDRDICSVGGCRSPVRYVSARLCSMHYQRRRKYGDPNITKADNSTPIEELFWRLADRTGGEGSCWQWRGSTDGRGYGALRSQKAYRFAYELLIGPIPEGLEIDHLCRNTMCVNPWHLEPVTHAENLRRGNSPWQVNRRKTHCKQGHKFTPENTRVDKHGWRSCRRCHVIEATERNRRLRAK
jgi:HNH endonuclease